MAEFMVGSMSPVVGSSELLVRRLRSAVSAALRKRPPWLRPQCPRAELHELRSEDADIRPIIADKGISKNALAISGEGVLLIPKDLFGTIRRLCRRLYLGRLRPLTCGSKLPYAVDKDELSSSAVPARSGAAGTEAADEEPPAIGHIGPLFP